MAKYNIIKERVATPKEVFDNLKNGGLKLLCENKHNNTITQVAWAGDNNVEFITIADDKRVAEYFEAFPYGSSIDLKNNSNYFKPYFIWYFGYIED